VALCLQNEWLSLVKYVLVTFGYVVDDFLSRKFKLIFENINKAGIYINKLISINHINYNAHVESHASEEFVGKTTRH
jgi:hypothetical protein